MHRQDGTVARPILAVEKPPLKLRWLARHDAAATAAAAC
jgi:hypothetical protein